MKCYFKFKEEELLQILLNRFNELYMPFKNHGDIKGVIDICGKKFCNNRKKHPSYSRRQY